MQKRIISIVLALGMILMSQLSLYAQSKKQMLCAGCKTEFFLMRDLCKAGSEKVEYTIKPGKTGNKKAIKLLLQNKVDFAFTCKHISKLTKKLKLDKTKVASWKSIAIAKDPIVLVTYKECGVGNLTVTQITDIFKLMFLLLGFSRYNLTRPSEISKTYEAKDPCLDIFSPSLYNICVLF